MWASEWVSEKPRVEGWYWWRNTPKHMSLRMVQIVKSGGVLYSVECNGYMILGKNINGEWFGPIIPPE